MRYYLLLALLGVSLGAAAQQKNTNDNLKKSIQEIGGLFKKKKKDSVSRATNGAAGVPVAVSSGSGRMLNGAGLPAAGAKYIDADQLYPFNAGSAMIRKGSSSALIDSAGGFIIPYNTYNLTGIFVAGPVGYTVRYNGIYTYNNINANWGGYINSKGKVIAKTGVNTNVINYSDNKLMLETNNSTRTSIVYTYTSFEGKTYTLGARLEEIVDGIGIVRHRANEGDRYMRVTGESLPGVFDDAAPFSDGMARVGKKDAFGVLKYGYINRQGKLAIPFTFSVVPGNFSGGYAKVQPADKSTFEYAFINKRGEIVFKQTLSDTYKNGVFDHFTNYGLAISEKCVMDTSFSIVPKGEFFKSFGIPADSWFVDGSSYTEGESNPKLVFSTRTARGQYTQMPVYGFINLGTRKVVMPVFDFINTNGLYFDPVSRLAYAKVCIGRDNKNVPVYREGYINEDGQFVLIKGSGSKW